MVRRILSLLGILPVLFCGGCGITSFLVTPVSAPTELTDVKVQGGGPGKIAIIEVEGTLANAITGGLLQQGENPLNLFVQELDKAANDKDVKAVVLRINSPGGSVTTSDTMYDAVLRFKAKTHKPVIASAQELDASGAYYVSCAADKIIATPTSLVGCIGVIFDSFDLKDLMDKLGVQSTAIKSAELKDMGSMFKHMTDHEKQVEQTLVDEFFARFKAVVMTGRPIKHGDEITKVSDGRVFSGQDSVALGLVDQVGQLQDAIDLAKQMCNDPKAGTILYKHAYGFNGSIYANTAVPAPQAQSPVNLINLKLPESLTLPSGFYYLWQP